MNCTEMKHTPFDAENISLSLRKNPPKSVRYDFMYFIFTEGTHFLDIDTCVNIDFRVSLPKNLKKIVEQITNMFVLVILCSNMQICEFTPLFF